MRNATSRSAILNSPTPLALVCVLFLILMHIQWIDLHYVLIAQCLFDMLFFACTQMLSHCLAYYSDGMYDLKFQTSYSNCRFIWYLLQWHDMGGVVVLAVKMCIFYLILLFSTMWVAECLWILKYSMHEQRALRWANNRGDSELTLRRWCFSVETARDKRNDTRCAETNNQKVSCPVCKEPSDAALTFRLQFLRAVSAVSVHAHRGAWHERAPASAVRL